MIGRRIVGALLAVLARRRAAEWDHVDRTLGIQRPTNEYRDPSGIARRNAWGKP